MSLLTRRILIIIFKVFALLRFWKNLNLCRETIEGIRTHSWGMNPPLPEGKVVFKLADKIAYGKLCDIEDSIEPV